MLHMIDTTRGRKFFDEKKDLSFTTVVTGVVILATLAISAVVIVTNSQAARIDAKPESPIIDTDTWIVSLFKDPSDFERRSLIFRKFSLIRAALVKPSLGLP